MKSDRLSREQQQLVVSHRRLGFKIAHQFRFARIPLDDLIGWADLGLVEAARRYDPSRGFAFSTYAGWWIRAFIMLEAQKVATVPGGNGWRMAFWRFRTNASDEALAAIAGVSVEELAAVRRRASSLMVNIDDAARVMVAPEIAADDMAQRHETRERLVAALAELPARWELVLRQRYLGDDEVKQQEIGKRLGISRSCVQQIEKRALRKLRRKRAVKELAR